jgi:hypothetical protein
MEMNKKEKEEQKRVHKFVRSAVLRLLKDKRKMKDLSILTKIAFRLKPDELKVLLRYFKMIEDNARWKTIIEISRMAHKFPVIVSDGDQPEDKKIIFLSELEQYRKKVSK